MQKVHVLLHPTLMDTQAAYADSLVGRDPADPLALWRARYLGERESPGTVVLGIDDLVGDTLRHVFQCQFNGLGGDDHRYAAFRCGVNDSFHGLAEDGNGYISNIKRCCCSRRSNQKKL